MHGTSKSQPAPLTTFGGLVTLANPQSLPEGASPRNNDVDYSVGGVGTRNGTTNIASFSNSFVGPSPGQSAVDFSLGGALWNNPGNTLVDTGIYATSNLLATVSESSSVSSGSSSGGGVAWANPSNIDSSSALATVSTLMP